MPWVGASSKNGEWRMGASLVIFVMLECRCKQQLVIRHWVTTAQVVTWSDEWQRLITCFDYGRVIAVHGSIVYV